MFRGIEKFETRMEDQDPQAESQETTVDVEVKVAEEVEAATSVVEEATSVIEDAAASDEAAEEVEALEHLQSVLKTHGMTPGLMAVINRDNKLSMYSGVALPAVESLDGVGTNHDAMQAAMEAADGMMKKAWEAIKKFFKSIWEKIKSLWAKLMNMLTSWESSIKRAKESLSGITIDQKKFNEKKVKLLKTNAYEATGTAVSDAFAVLDSATKSRATENAVVSALSKKSTVLVPLGLKLSDGQLSTIEDSKYLNPEEKPLKSLGWTIDYAIGAGFKVATNAVSDIRGGKGAISSFEALCQEGIKKTESVQKSQGDSSEKKSVSNLRKNASDASKLFGKITSKASLVPRTYIQACAALRACKA